MNKNIVLGMLVALIIGSIYYLEGTKVDPGEINIEPPVTGSAENNDGTILNGNQAQTQASTKTPQQKQLSQADAERIRAKENQYRKAPELTGIVGYLNAEEGIKISDFTSKGKVVLIDFWTYTCINCIRTLPHLVEWDKKYRDKGLVIIGVHTPEFEFEKKYENVKMAMEKYGIGYRVVQDNSYATWRAFKNNYWPRKYLIDPDGFIRYDHIGEGAYEETELSIQELLKEAGQNVNDMETSGIVDKTPRLRQTPELYAGHGFALSRGQDVGNKEGLQPGVQVDYRIPADLTNDVIYLGGKWQSNEDNLQAKEDNASIILKFTAGSVNIVANTISRPVKLHVFIDDRYIKKWQAGTDVMLENGEAYALIDTPRLYNVVNGQHGAYKLKLAADSSDFYFNAFTFG
ncbi:redoxin domain-containing protein [Candidatus Woesearchaeota archaeon]|nr:redoxin domain-containing protein [Candidatus Woesearchaeota archaeon]